MRDKITTTRNGFRLEDVTFRNMRKQSEIKNELGLEDVIEDEDDVEVPNSITPEQVKFYLEEIINSTEDRQKKKVFSQIIRWIRELDEAKAKLKTYREKELAQLAHENISDEI